MLAPFLILLSAAPATAPASPAAQVAAVLDDWHDAAAHADFARYFGHFTPDAVFLGTDASERWTRDEFARFAKPFFDKGKAWSFRAVSRRVSLSRDGNTAWFDEALDTPNLGPARGSGVLVREGAQWKIAHYDLSVPIPNALLREFKARIAAQPPARRDAQPPARRDAQPPARRD